jgi:shikimate kinase / 3-dehydroquinate synthase
VAPSLILTGFMGCGKSSVGRRVAALLDREFIDLDEAFVSAEGEAIVDYFAKHGEAAFRAKECELLEGILRGTASGPGCVLALGGGTLETPTARELVTSRGGVVYLEVDAQQAWQRARDTGRPLAADQAKFGALLARRQAVYEGAANWILPVEDRSIEDVSREIVQLLRTAGDAWTTLWGRRLRATQRASLVTGGVGALSTLSVRAKGVREAGRRLFVITDHNVAAAWGERIAELAELSLEADALVIEAGEASKSVTNLGLCWNWLAQRKARRDDVVVALGGGVVGDLAGFAAATYQRGVELWQVPTTLLAQVDSSVGGKTAIDLAAGKNLVGAFYQPDLVVADPQTLSTLSGADFVGGLGEVVKHALLISPDALTRLEAAAPGLAARDLSTIAAAVKESVDFKARVVQQDEREQGVRAVLNLGHTVGHALEVVEGYGYLSHGAAVALGLQVALAVSEDCLGLDPSVRDRVRRLCGALGLATQLRLPPVERLLGAAGRDKKVRAGSSGFVGLRALGEPVWGVNVSAEQLTRSLEVIRA